MLRTQGFRPLGRLLAVQIQQRHSPAGMGQLLRCGPANALGCTGDDDHGGAAHESRHPGMSLARISRVSCAVIR